MQTENTDLLLLQYWGALVGDQSNVVQRPSTLGTWRERAGCAQLLSPFQGSECVNPAHPCQVKLVQAPVLSKCSEAGVPDALASWDVSHFPLAQNHFSWLPKGPAGATATGNHKQMLGNVVGQWVKCKGNKIGKNHSTFTFKIDSNIEVGMIYKLEEGQT